MTSRDSEQESTPVLGTSTSRLEHLGQTTPLTALCIAWYSVISLSRHSPQSRKTHSLSMLKKRNFHKDMYRLPSAQLLLQSQQQWALELVQWPGTQSEQPVSEVALDSWGSLFSSSAHDPWVSGFPHISPILSCTISLLSCPFPGLPLLWSNQNRNAEKDS